MKEKKIISMIDDGFVYSFLNSEISRPIIFSCKIPKEYEIIVIMILMV